MLNGSQFWDRMCGEDTSTDTAAEDDASPALWGSQPTIDDNTINPGQSAQGGAIFDVPQGCTRRYVIVGEDASGPGPGKRMPLP